MKVEAPLDPAQKPLRGAPSVMTRLCAMGRGLLHDFRHQPRLPSVRRVLTSMRDWPRHLRGVRGRLFGRISEEKLRRLCSEADYAALLEMHLACERAIDTQRPLLPGNKLTLLQNGPDTYAAMMAAITGARDHVHLETYIFDGDDAGARFAEALIERQAAGVPVALIFDSAGSLATPRTFFERMTAAGIDVLEFNPLNPLVNRRDAWTFNHRDHRKLLIVDGRIAFIGGVNISRTYSSAPSGRKAGAAAGDGWRDTHLQIEGPVVAEFQKLFLQTRSRQQRDPLPGRDYFPEIPMQGEAIVRALGSSAERGDSPIYLTLISAIHRAQQHIHMTVAYFAPDRQLLLALIRAARRGVDVKLILPSRSDFWMIFHLGRSYYGRLLRAGVRIFEREGSVMHAKTVCIDGVWSTVGSSNMDLRSFLHNDEVNAVILGRAFGAEMDRVFSADIEESRPISRARWRRRSPMLRLKERIARLFAYWL
jgi:cardiolipin synthase